jgi:aminocarboxymuconate-semialdehyde decarboxylase
MRVIDMHTHFFPRALPDLTARLGGEAWPRIEPTGPTTSSIYIGDKHFRDITQECWDVDARLQSMDAQGIDCQVICSTPVLFSYTRPARHALEMARLANDIAREICEASGGRLLSLCQVPLQDPALACEELTRCMAAGHRGVQIGNHVGDMTLDEPALVDFLAHCAAENAAVLVHPWDMMARERMKRYMTMYTVGMPTETHLTLTAMILGGAFDRLPRSLRICFAHGGGSFPGLIGRLDQAWHHGPRGEGKGKASRPPSAYVDRFFVDSIVYDSRMLEYMVEVLGEDQILLGSDFPFDIAEKEIGSVVRNADLSERTKQKILGDNVVRFLGMDA